VWRSPAGQPPWARPALLVVTALSALAYSWQVGSTIETFYAAAVRSMTESWHNFLFGAFDPSGTITVLLLPPVERLSLPTRSDVPDRLSDDAANPSSDWSASPSRAPPAS